MKNKEKITKLLEDYIKENLELKELEEKQVIFTSIDDAIKKINVIKKEREDEKYNELYGINHLLFYFF